MAETKRVLRFYQYNQCDEFAVYLNDMARKGRHFKEFKLGLVFEKGEPEDSFYDVTVMSNRDSNVRGVNDEDLDLADYCEAAGWELIDATEFFCVFKRVTEDAIPIVSTEEKVEEILHIEKKNRIVFLALLLFGIFYCILEFSILFSDLYESWYDSIAIDVLELVGILAAFYFGIVGFILNFIHCRKLKSTIDSGKEIFFGRRNKKDPAKPVYPLNWIYISLMIFVIVVIICHFIVGSGGLIVTFAFWAAYSVTQIMGSYKKERRTESRNKMMVIILVIFLITMISIPIYIFVFEDDEKIPKAPLYPTEIFQTNKKYTIEDDFNEYDSTFLGNHYTYTFSAENEDNDDLYFSYEVYHCKISSLIQYTWNYYTEKDDDDFWDWQWQTPEKIDASIWGAEEAYQVDYRYFIRYKHSILIINEHDYTKEQIETIKQKLEVN